MSTIDREERETTSNGMIWSEIEWDFEEEEEWWLKRKINDIRLCICVYRHNHRDTFNPSKRRKLSS